MIGKGKYDNQFKTHKTTTCKACWLMVPANSWSSHKLKCTGNLLSCEKCLYTTALKGHLNRHNSQIHESVEPNIKEEILHSCASKRVPSQKEEKNWLSIIIWFWPSSSHVKKSALKKSFVNRFLDSWIKSNTNTCFGVSLIIVLFIWLLNILAKNEIKPFYWVGVLGHLSKQLLGDWPSVLSGTWKVQWPVLDPAFCTLNSEHYTT